MELCFHGCRHNKSMTPYTFLESIEAEVAIPENGILSRTLFNDDALKVVAFGFAAGQELSAHTAPMAAILYIVKGEAELTLGTEKKPRRRSLRPHDAANAPWRSRQDPAGDAAFDAETSSAPGIARLHYVSPVRRGAVAV